MRNHGNVYIYGQHWQAYDFKAEAQAFVKAKRSFKLSEARMLEVKNDKVGFKAVYNGEYCYHAVLKRGKKWASFQPSQLPNENTVKEVKRKDVLVLLSEIGVSDLSQPQMNDVVEDSDSHEEQLPFEIEFSTENKYLVTADVGAVCVNARDNVLVFFLIVVM